MDPSSVCLCFESNVDSDAQSVHSAHPESYDSSYSSAGQYSKPTFPSPLSQTSDQTFYPTFQGFNLQGNDTIPLDGTTNWTFRTSHAILEVLYEPLPHGGVGSPTQYQQQQDQPITNVQKKLKSTFADSTHYSARFEFFYRASFRQSSLIEVMANARLLNSISPLPCVFHEKQSMNDLKLRRPNELNSQLREDLERPRIKGATWSALIQILKA